MPKLTKEKLAAKAAFTNDLKYILIDYFSFRVQITWKKDEKKTTLYGHEHFCSYEQCLHTKVPHIVLNKLKGYTALLDYIHAKRSQIKKAVLYMRQPGEADFNNLCRRYYNGEPDEEVNDPVLTGNEEVILQYQIINGRVIIKTPPSSATAENATDALPDFKAEIEKNLLKKIIMPAYSFQERFVPFVKNDSKQQTVRAYKKNGVLPRVGQLAYLFFGLRTKWSHRLKTAGQPINCVRTIFISAPVNMVTPGSIYLMDAILEKTDAEAMLQDESFLTDKRCIKLTAQQANEFAWFDGFRPDGASIKNPEGCFELMYRFFRQTHALPFTGTVIYWTKH